MTNNCKIIHTTLLLYLLSMHVHHIITMHVINIAGINAAIWAMHLQNHHMQYGHS